MDIGQDEWLRYQRYLLAVAYRLLGSVTDAEDAVQESYLHLRRDDVNGVVELRAWLTTVVSRICLEHLRSARVQRETYIGPWLPEPQLSTVYVPDPADRVTLTESVQTAMLVVLEALTPAERVAFVLHDVFGISFGQIADIVGRTPAACRQLASRARTQVHIQAPRFEVSTADRDRVVSAFLAATTQGDLETLVRALDPDVVFRSDGGGIVPAARRPVRGAARVARLLLGLAPQYSEASLRVVDVNGAPGVLIEDGGAVVAVVTLTVSPTRVTAIDVVLNPAKLRHLQPQLTFPPPVSAFRKPSNRNR